MFDIFFRIAERAVADGKNYLVITPDDLDEALEAIEHLANTPGASIAVGNGKVLELFEGIAVVWYNPHTGRETREPAPVIRGRLERMVNPLWFKAGQFDGTLTESLGNFETLIEHVRNGHNTMRMCFNSTHPLPEKVGDAVIQHTAMMRDMANALHEGYIELFKAWHEIVELERELAPGSMLTDPLGETSWMVTAAGTHYVTAVPLSDGDPVTWNLEESEGAREVVARIRGMQMTVDSPPPIEIARWLNYRYAVRRLNDIFSSPSPTDA